MSARAELSGYVPIKQRDKLASNTIMVVRHPDHQKYWFTASGGFGALGIAMIATAAALASSTAHLALTGRFMIIAYIAFCCAVACFAGGIRQAPFPFAAGDIDPARVAEPPAIQPASPVQVTFIPEPDTDLLRLVAVNEGDRADFTAQVIGFIDELGRNRTRQTWPIPWEEDGSTTAKEILTYQKPSLTSRGSTGRHLMRIFGRPNGAPTITGTSSPLVIRLRSPTRQSVIGESLTTACLL